MAEATDARIIPLSEVAQHTARATGVWMAISGNVYDITDFLDEHPGGPEIVMEHAGKDATKDFEEIGHSKSAKQMMNKYKIGSLPEGEGIRSATASSGVASGAGSSSSGGDDSSSSVGTYMLYLIPVVLLGFGLWYQFLRPQPADK